MGVVINCGSPAIRSAEASMGEAHEVPCWWWSVVGAKPFEPRFPANCSPGSSAAQASPRF